MKHFKTRGLTTLALSLAAVFCLHAQLKHVPQNAVIPQHPRLLLLAGEEQQVKDNISSDPLYAGVHKAIIDECDKIVALPELQRIMTGKRLLSVSREALRRLFYLSYAYRMSGEGKYLEKTVREMMTVSAFSDWNPSHFLDVAEMTMALSIGYDWLYASLSPDVRSTVAQAILQKGIDPSMNSSHAWYLTATHNWNQVCNAGISFGAIALCDELPELSKFLIDRAVESIRRPMKDYEPDGAYPEGYGYWDYGTGFNVMFLSAVEKLFGSDLGLTASSAFLKTAAYQQNMTGPLNICFNYCDCGLGGSLSPAMFWFASKLKEPSLLRNEKNYLERKAPNVRERLLPAIMIWGKDMNMKDIPSPKYSLWVGHGITPVALMRTSWTDTKAVYLAFKGGTGASNHAHLDAGSFVMEADGVRWASDFGMQDYNSLESKGVDLWNRSQNSQRWEVFRLNNFTHNTLTVDGLLHRVAGYADIGSTSSKPDFLSAISDLSKIFEGQLAKSVRGVAIVNRQYVIVRDEIQTLDKVTTLRWTMLTTADASIAGNNIIELRKDGQRLRISVAEPAHKVKMRIWPTTPPHDYDTPNPGTTLIGFEVVVPANTSTALTVKLIPQNAKKTSTAVAPLSEWPRD